MPSISADERQQVKLVRVICIFLMMSVHVNPGMSNPSLVSSGSLYWLGEIWPGTLGRASVAALSVVSGYLLVRTTRASVLGLAQIKVATLIVPMLVWDLIFGAMVYARSTLDPSEPVPAFTAGILEPTVNLSLWFLRDLFVSLLLVRIGLPVLLRAPALVFAGLVVVAVRDLAEPLVFRPSILLFVATGAFIGTRSTLSGWLTVERAALALALLGGAHVALRFLPAADALAASNLIWRAALVVAVLMLTQRLVGTGVGAFLAPWERRIFETYLLHGPLFGVLWFGWEAFVGGPMDASYLLFFALAPVAAMLAGVLFGAACDHLPPALQRALRGKATPRMATIPA